MLTRRLFLATASAAATLPLTGSALASPTVGPAPGAAPAVPTALEIPLPPPAASGAAVVANPLVANPLVANPLVANPLVERARAELARLGEIIPHHDIVAVADYGSASKTPRFHLLDMARGTVSSLLVSHGRGSDPGNSGWVKAFSNAFGSNASSEGAFRTAELYSGKHGRSMRLDGLDAGNSNARDRAIVIHSAWYVNPSMAAAAGRIGRSEGCFAFSDADLPKVLERLGSGRLLLSTKL